MCWITCCFVWFFGFVGLHPAFMLVSDDELRHKRFESGFIL